MASSDISNRASLGLPSDNTHGRACLGLPSDNTHAHWQAKEVFKHIERLKYQDEDWQARDASSNKIPGGDCGQIPLVNLEVGS